MNKNIYRGGSKSFTTEQFIEKAQKIHGEKYDYSKVKYINAKTRVCIICPIHGEFWQTPDKHLSKRGCPLCGIEQSHDKTRFDTEQFILKAKQIHGDKYDYSKVEYKNCYTEVTIICPIHGEFKIIPDRHLQGCGCKQCKYETISKKLSKTTEYFIEQAKLVHGNKYDYSKVIYKKKQRKSLYYMSYSW